MAGQSLLGRGLRATFAPVQRATRRGPPLVASRTPNLAPTPGDAHQDLQKQKVASQSGAEKTLQPGAAPDLGISASYFMLRRGLAILAFLFPIVLTIGAGLNNLQDSLSAYYHFSVAAPHVAGAGTMRNVFVGVLWAVGAFLFLYKGYSRREDWALNIAGVAAVLIAMFPMDWAVGAPPQVVNTPIGTTHYASATIFFLMIAFVCVFCADETVKLLNKPEDRRKYRNTYRVLGLCMVLMPILVLLLFWVWQSRLILVLESVGIFVFSAFWVVKSGEIWLIEEGGG